MCIEERGSIERDFNSQLVVTYGTRADLEVKGSAMVQLRPGIRPGKGLEAR